MHKTFLSPFFYSLARGVAVLCLTLAVHAVPLGQACAAAPSAASTVTRAEWTAYLQQDASLGTADKELNAVYRKLMSSLSPAEKRVILAEQRAWVIRRDTKAFAAHPKGTPEYVATLTAITMARCAELRALQADRAEKTPDSVSTMPSDLPAAQSPQPAPAPLVLRPHSLPELPPATAPQQSRTQPAPLPAEPRSTKPQGAAPAAAQAAVPAPPPVPGPRSAAPENAAAPSTPTPELSIALHARKQEKTARPQTQIDLTPARFARSYNMLAQGFRAAPFPLVPTNISGGNTNRTEHYQIQHGISIQFKYTQNLFDKPEVITFIGRQFMTGPNKHRDDIAGSLVTLLKALNENALSGGKASDEEIFGFMRSISQAFSSDTSRVWKNNGLVYVITYMKKTDLFAMTISLDQRNRFQTQ